MAPEIMPTRAVDNPDSVWLVTGASRGMGCAIAAAAVARGRLVVATFRDRASVAAFSGERTLGVLLDVTDQASIASCVTAAVARFGRIDVLVNNAGAGLFGAVEEVTPESFRALIDVNLLGPAAMLQAVLPVMRAQREGLIYQMSSVSGFVALPGLGHYAATKFALEGLSEALAAEVAALGVRVVLVEPGPFRTDWIAGAAQNQGRRIADYADTAHRQIQQLEALDGRQGGDPVKAADLLLELASLPELPLRLPLGAVAFDRIQAKIERMRVDIGRVRSIASATDFEE